MATNVERVIHFAQCVDSKSSSIIKKFTETTLKTANKCTKQWLNTENTEEIEVAKDFLNFTGNLGNDHTATTE